MNQLDNLDYKILCELDKNSRLTESQIGKKLKKSKQVIKYRIQKLINNNYIKNFQTAVDLKSIGINIYGNVYFNLINCDSDKETEIITYLIEDKNSLYVATTGGKFDLSIVLLAEDLHDFTNKLDHITSKYSDNLVNQNISLRVVAKKFHKDYLLNSKTKYLNEFNVMQSKHKQKLDVLDKKILKLLSNNSRLNIVNIANELKKPVTTVYNRFKNLLKNKIILGFPCLLNLKKLGLQNYKIFLTLKQQDESTEMKLYSICANNPNITWFFKTIAPWTHEIRVETKDQESLQKIIKEIKDKMNEKIMNFETLTVFEEFKEDFSALFEE